MTAITDEVQPLIDAVRRLAADNPGYVYQWPGTGSSCLYVHDGQGSCLIGQAALAIGLIDVGIETDNVNQRDVLALLKSKGVRASDAQKAWLEEVQARQDGGMSWSYAVGSADALVDARDDWDGEV